jgi:hypothetical protein
MRYLDVWVCDSTNKLVGYSGSFVSYEIVEFDGEPGNI